MNKTINTDPIECDFLDSIIIESGGSVHDDADDSSNVVLKLDSSSSSESFNPALPSGLPDALEAFYLTARLRGLRG